MGTWCNRRRRPSSLPRPTAAASRVSLDRMTERILATSQWILGNRLEWPKAKSPGPEVSQKSCLGMETSLRTALSACFVPQSRVNLILGEFAALFHGHVLFTHSFHPGGSTAASLAEGDGFICGRAAQQVPGVEMRARAGSTVRAFSSGLKKINKKPDFTARITGLVL